MRLLDSKKQADKQLDKLLVEQSSELFEAMQRGGEAERQALADWLSQSKRHVRTHLFMSALEDELRHLDPERKIRIPDVRLDLRKIRTLKNEDFPVSMTGDSQRRRQGRMSWKWMAVAVVVLSVGAATLYGPAVDYLNGWREFRTAIGEQRSVSLSDGSIVQLNTETRIRARVSEQSRDIRLLAGEALFKVAHDPARPFNVRTADASILAVGTQFNVYQADGRTRVSVLEGRVRVAASGQAAAVQAAPVIPAGQEVEVHNGRSVQHKMSDVASAAAWVQRRIVFKQEPLADVVTQFNRYRKTPRLRIEDAELAARKYSGTFDVDDPKSLEDVLSNERDVVLERSGDEIVIRERHATDN